MTPKVSSARVMVTVALPVVLLSSIAEHSCEHGGSHLGCSEKAMMRMRAMGRQVGVVAVATGAPTRAGGADVVTSTARRGPNSMTFKGKNSGVSRI